MKIIRYSLKKKPNLRSEKDFPKKGIDFIDINPLIMDKNSFEEIINIFVELLENTKIDYIVAPESRGFLFGSTIANKIGVNFIPVRKKGKLPPSYVEKTFEYEKEYGKDFLELPKLDKRSYKNKKFYVVDDIYATGNTVRSIKGAIKELGGKVIGVGVIVNILELNKDNDVFSIIDVHEN